MGLKTSFLTSYQKRLTSSVSYEALQAVKVKPSQVFSKIKSITDCMYSTSFRLWISSYLLANHKLDNYYSNGYIKKKKSSFICIYP